MPEFSIGPEGYIKKIRGSISGLPPQERQEIEGGRVPESALVGRNQALEHWPQEVDKKPVLGERQKQIISLAENALGDFEWKYGVRAPAPSVYYLTEERWKGLMKYCPGNEKNSGFFDVDNNCIFIRLTKKHQNNLDLIDFLDTNLHERLHQQAFRAVQAWGEGLDLVREGLDTVNVRKGKRYFSDFDEGIISYFSGRMTENVVDTNKFLFKKELERDQLRRGSFSGDLEEAIFRMKKNDFAYRFSVDVIRKLIKSLSYLRGGRPQDVEEIEKIFINAEFKGNLLDLGKEVAKLYGKGGLRVLAHLNEKNSGLVQGFLRAKGLATQRRYAEKILPPEEFERYKKLMVESGEEVESEIDQKSWRHKYNTGEHGTKDYRQKNIDDRRFSRL